MAIIIITTETADDNINIKVYAATVIIIDVYRHRRTPITRKDS